MYYIYLAIVVIDCIMLASPLAIPPLNLTIALLCIVGMYKTRNMDD
jgi:hypothetical protein